jgi:hypothetical protein
MCGAPNEDDADFCGNCGAAMNAENVSTEEETWAEGSQASEPVEEAVDEPADEGTAVAGVEAAPAESSPRPAPASVALPTSGLAVASLVSGVAGLILLPLVGCVLAIILGYMARREIRQRPGEISGDGLALAGIVLGWIGVGLIVVACLFFGGLAACGMVGALSSGVYQ